MSEQLPTHYRLSDYDTLDRITVNVQMFKAIKETPKGYWVESEYSAHWMTFQQKRARKMVRFILKNSVRKYCYPELTLALNSFDIRKYRQIEYLKNQLERAEIAYSAVETLRTKNLEDFKQGVIVGQRESQKGIDFFPNLPLATA